VASGPETARGTTAIGVAKAASYKGLKVQLTCAVGEMQWLGDPEEIDADAEVQSWVQQTVEFNNETEAWQWLQEMVHANRPVIASINEHPEVDGSALHSVVVVAVSTDTVTIIDPEQASLLRHIKTSQFLTFWGAVLYIALLLTDPSR
jgi:hypothetical protein